MAVNSENQEMKKSGPGSEKARWDNADYYLIIFINCVCFRQSPESVFARRLPRFQG